MTKHELNFNFMLYTCFVESDRTIKWLSERSDINQGQLEKWLYGPTKRPAANSWRKLLRLAQLMELTESRTNALLATTREPGLSELKRHHATSPEDIALLGTWRGPFLAPPCPAPFVGREAECDVLLDGLTGKGSIHHLVHGMAGVGKSSLAAYLAHQLDTHFVDGVLWADMADDSDDSLRSKMQLFGTALGFKLNAQLKTDDMILELRNILVDRKILIVLDDVQSGKQIEQFMPSKGDSVLLITTRKRALARSSGFKSVELNPPAATSDFALAIFTERIGEQRVQAEIQSFRKIATLLGHLPLALDIVAQQLAANSDWTAQTFLKERLVPEHERLQTLTLDHIGVRLSFNVSFQQLQQEEKDAYLTLGTFNGQSFTLDAAAAAVAKPKPQARTLLNMLGNYNLLQKGILKRYRLHPLLNQFTRDLLTDPDAYGRKAAYYTDYAQANRYQHQSMQLELENILQSLEDAHTHHLDDLLVTGLDSAHPFLLANGSFDSLNIHLKRGLSLARQQAQPHDEARLRAALGVLHVRRGELVEATEHLDKAHTLATHHKLQEVLFTVAKARGGLAIRSNAKKAKQQWEIALSIARKLRNDHEIGMLCYNLALLRRREGMRDEERLFLDEGLHHAKRAKNNSIESGLQALVGNGLLDKGEFVPAEKHLQRSLALAEREQNKRRMIQALLSLGYLESSRGNLDTARLHLQAGVKYAEAVHAKDQLVLLLANLGEVAGMDNAFSEADTYFAKGLRLVHETNNSDSRVVLITEVARVACLRGDLEAAEKHLREIQQMSPRSARRQTEWLLVQGLFSLQSNDGGNAQKAFHEAARLANEAGMVYSERKALEALERLLNGKV